MSIPILRLSPHLTPRPWGGERLRTRLGKESPVGEKIGESWELSDHPDGPSTIAEGPFAGRRFGDLVRDHPVDTIGTDTAPKKFPLLIKYLDAAEDLSVQVHPDDAANREMGVPDRGKTECWYILDCDQGTEVIYGLSEGVTREDLEAAVREKTVADLTRRVPLTPGLFLYVPAGTVHALLGGTLACEIQQSSNVTYRLWDWNRKPERELHVEASLRVIDFDGGRTHDPVRLSSAPPEIPRIVPLTTNPLFSVKAIQLGPNQSLLLPPSATGVAINGVGGECFLDEVAVGLGDTLFVPACCPGATFRTKDSPATLLVSRSNE